MDTSDDTPDIVTVTGTDSTPDAKVTMIEGTTGARIPTGAHQRSGAMPDETGTSRGNGNGLAALAVLGVVLVLLALIAFVLR